MTPLVKSLLYKYESMSSIPTLEHIPRDLIKIWVLLFLHQGGRQEAPQSFLGS